MLRLVLLVLLTAAPLAAQTPGATGALEGFVTDDTGEALPLANIKVEGRALGVATDFDGRYRIEDVPVGAYTVTASFAGLQSEARYEVGVYRGAPRVLNFELGERRIIECFSPVAYQRPLISNDPFAGRVIEAEELVNLPVR